MNIFQKWLETPLHALSPALKDVFCHSMETWLNENDSFKPNASDLSQFLEKIPCFLEKKKGRSHNEFKYDADLDLLASKVSAWLMQFPMESCLNEYDSIFKSAIEIGGAKTLSVIWSHPDAPKIQNLSNLEQKKLGIIALPEQESLIAMQWFSDHGFQWKNVENVFLRVRSAEVVEFLFKQNCNRFIKLNKEEVPLDVFWRTRLSSGYFNQKEVEKMLEKMRSTCFVSEKEKQEAFFQEMWQMSSSHFSQQIKQLNLDKNTDEFRIQAWRGWIKLNTSYSRLSKAYKAGQKWALENPPLKTDFWIDNKTPLSILLSSLKWDYDLLRNYTRNGGFLNGLFKNEILLKINIEKKAQFLIDSLIPFSNQVSEDWVIFHQQFLNQSSDEERAFWLAKELVLKDKIFNSELVWISWLKNFEKCSDEALKKHQRLFQSSIETLFHKSFYFYNPSLAIAGISVPFKNEEILFEKLKRLELLPLDKKIKFPSAWEDYLNNLPLEIQTRWMKSYQDYRLPSNKIVTKSYRI